MACPGAYDTTRNLGVTWCEGSCGGNKRLEWQKKEHTYPNGAKCSADYYVGCC